MSINTKLLMASSAFALAAIGLCLTFLATEIANYFLLSSPILLQLFIQVLGALYFAFALLNWMAKGNVLGGIFNRPIVLANFAHFLIGGLALIKSLKNHPELPVVIWLAAGLYLIFALLFGLVFYRAPVAKKQVAVANG